MYLSWHCVYQTKLFCKWIIVLFSHHSKTELNVVVGDVTVSPDVVKYLTISPTNL